MSWLVTTFNCNGVRARMDILVDWLAANEPDVVCLQETKVQDKDFPLALFDQAGYSVAFIGQKSYNGVAILSRTEADEVVVGFGDGGDESQARLISARFGERWVVNTYVPQGREVGSEQFAYKLDFYARLQHLFAERFEPDGEVLWCGDLNVAMTDLDVHDPDKLRGKVCFHPDEQAALAKTASWGFSDLFRRHHPDERQFSFWDYRVPNGLKRNIGWRIDYVMVTASLAERSLDCWVDSEPRSRTKPSDHTFVLAKFD